MNFSETLKLALSAIWAHKLRSFLTLLGMIIGVTAFMVVLSLLQGFNTYVDEKIRASVQILLRSGGSVLKISKTPTRLPKRSGATRN